MTANKFKSHPPFITKLTNLPVADSLPFSNEVREGSRLNDQQLEAIAPKNLLGKYVISAGAGVGKSTVLIERLKSIQSTYPEAKTLMITFSKKAALELRDRLGMNAHNVMVSTFHSVAYKMLKGHRDYADFNVVTNTAVLDSVIGKLIKNDFITIDDVKLSLMAPHKATKETLEIRKKFLGYLRKKHLMSFDTMQVLAVEMLKSDKAALHYYQQHWNFILVDEAQDMDSQQCELVELLSAKSNNCVFCGDSRQSIYSFRTGSTDDVLKHFAEGAVVMEMTTNYRCSDKILGLANKIMAEDKPLIAAYPSVNAPYPLYLAATDEKEEAEQVLLNVRKLHKKGVAYSDIALLYRSVSASSELVNTLLLNEIPFRCASVPTPSVLEAPFNGLIQLMRLSLEPDNAELLKSVLPFFYVKRSMAKSVIDLARKLGITLVAALKELDVPFFHAEYIASLADSILNASSDAEKAARAIVKAGYGKYVGKEQNSLLEAFLSDLGEFTSVQAYIAHVDDLLDRYNELRAAGIQSEDAVQLMSIHASKGMEFNSVFLIGADDDTLPSGRDGADLAEEKRLLYVAVTRAKHDLFISYPKSRANSTDILRPSRFLEGLF